LASSFSPGPGLGPLLIWRTLGLGGSLGWHVCRGGSVEVGICTPCHHPVWWSCDIMVCAQFENVYKVGQVDSFR
jgi:hypothetical protein